MRSGRYQTMQHAASVSSAQDRLRHRPDSRAWFRACALGFAMAAAGCHHAAGAPSLNVVSPTLAAAPQTLPDGEPLLRLPVPAGEVALCQQGNLSPKPLSHSNDNTRHALDLAAPGAVEVPIVASAAGTVVRVVEGALPDAVRPGAGFGNHVVVEHAGGYFTAYSHLDQVSVRKGQVVLAGARLGTMGRTGMAGNRHLHFSLHRSAGGEDGLPFTIPMRAIVVATPATPESEAAQKPWRVELRSSLELTCSNATVSLRGGFYGSENDGARAQFGDPNASLSAALARSLRGRIEATPLDVRGDTVNGDVKALGAKKAIEKLEGMLERHPRDPGALYWAAVVASRDLHDSAKSRALLERLDALHVTEPVWVAPWTALRLATLAEERGDLEDARARARTVLAVVGQGPDFDGRRDALATRLGLASPAVVPSTPVAPIPPCDAQTPRAPVACMATSRGKKGLVVFLHGKFSGRADADALDLVRRRAEAAGLSVLALYGEAGLCSWEAKPQDFVCWPQEGGQLAEARRLTAAWPALVARARQDAKVVGGSWLVGYSNGAFMAARAAADGLGPRFDGIAVLLGGVSGPVARRSGVVPKLAILAGTDDPHHRVSALEASRSFSEAGFAHTVRVREGGHELTGPDVDWAFDALGRR